MGGAPDLDVIPTGDEPPARRRRRLSRRWWWAAGVFGLLVVLALPVRTRLARHEVRDLDRRWMTALQLRAERTRVLGELRNRLLPTDSPEVLSKPATRLDAEERAIERRLPPHRGFRTWLARASSRAPPAIRHNLPISPAVAH